MVTNSVWWQFRSLPWRLRKPRTVRIGPAEITLCFGPRDCMACRGNGWFYTKTGIDPDPMPEGYDGVGLCGYPLWWLSFCDPAKAPAPEFQRPGGPSFLGAVITQAPTLAAAITRSHVLKVNPGGEIKIVGPIPAEFIAPEWRDRLLSADEIDALPEPEGLGGSGEGCGT
jgi:hypothetical protein